MDDKLSTEARTPPLDRVTKELEVYGGENITDAISKALAMASTESCAVSFEFNGTMVIVNAGDDPEVVEAKWRTDMDDAAKAYRESPEYIERERVRAAEQIHLATRSLTESATTEAALRAATVPYPHTPEQLAEYIASLVKRDHDYGTCVYAMSMAATAAFNYVAHSLGVSGFQASCADLDIVRRTRLIDGPFMLVKADDALYPQSNPVHKLGESMEKWKPWLKEQAAAKLATTPNAHPEVLHHWERLSKYVVKPDD